MTMLAIAAAITFALGFLLALLNTGTGDFNLLYLGLALLALHFVVSIGLPGRRDG